MGCRHYAYKNATAALLGVPKRWLPYPALMGSRHNGIDVIAASGIAQEDSEEIIAASSGDPEQRLVTCLYHDTFSQTPFW